MKITSSLKYPNWLKPKQNYIIHMNVTEINTISKLEKLGYIGTDADLATSLFDYGLAWKEEGNQIEFIYAIGGDYDKVQYTKFDQITFNTDLDVRKEFDWADFEEVEKAGGLSSEQFDALELPFKINDLIGYYGFENVCGSSYWEGFEIEEDNI